MQGLQKRAGGERDSLAEGLLEKDAMEVDGNDDEPFVQVIYNELDVKCGEMDNIFAYFGNDNKMPDRV